MWKTFRWILLIVLILTIAVIAYFSFTKKDKMTDAKTQDQTIITKNPPTENKFGFLSGGEEGNNFIVETGAGWLRPHPGPFLWDAMQSSNESEIDFTQTDKVIKANQKLGLGTLATLWPFAEWDQKNGSDMAKCEVSPTDEFLQNSKESTPKGRADYLPRYRCNPVDWEAYLTWVTAVSERYDGDGQDDMPELLIKLNYYEVMNEPDLQWQTKIGADRLNFYKQGPVEYGELLQKTSEAIKKADPKAQVLIAGAAGADERMLSFWESLFEKVPDTVNFFDIANIHAISNDRQTKDFNIGPYKEVLKKYNIGEKPIWVTEAEALYGQSFNENVTNTTESVRNAFAAGAQKIFFTRFNFEPESIIQKDFEANIKAYKQIISQY